MNINEAKLAVGNKIITPICNCIFHVAMVTDRNRRFCKHNTLVVIFE